MPWEVRLLVTRDWQPGVQQRERDGRRGCTCSNVYGDDAMIASHESFFGYQRPVPGLVYCRFANQGVARIHLDRGTWFGSALHRQAVAGELAAINGTDDER